MFSPGTKRTNLSSRKLGHQPPDSPITPVQDYRSSLVPNRPTTGTPAPWAPRLSVLARIPPTKKSEKENEEDSIKPVYVGEFPQVVRDEQASFLQKRVPGDSCISGGMDRDACLSWIVCGNKLFIWSYLSSSVSKDCVVLELPSDDVGDGEIKNSSYYGNNWMLCVVNWEKGRKGRNKGLQSRKSAGIVMCNRLTQSVIYWPDIYCEEGSHPVDIVLSNSNLELTSLPVDRKSRRVNRLLEHNRPTSRSTVLNSLTSMIASAVPGSQHECISLVCTSNGELWHLYCTPKSIKASKVLEGIVNPSFNGNESGHSAGSKGYPRSLVWHFSSLSTEGFSRQFLVLTDCEILCFSVAFHPIQVSKVWSHEIVGTDGDSGIKKDLAGQKRIWPLDMQVDDQNKVITVLVATFCKDRVSSSSYTQYSLLTMQYKSDANLSSDVHGRVLEKKAPVQVIIPKARVEDEDFLFSMRLKVGGRPSGSTIILSGDGTATVSYCYRNAPRLYQFDLPYDAGKVLDASVLPSASDGEDGAWVVLTEKAGVWAIPAKAIVVGGVEPPERSLSRKGSSNERSAQEERKNEAFASNVPPRRAISEAWDSESKQKSSLSGMSRRTVQDDESEALLSQLFHDFLLTEQVNASFLKLQNSGAFERDGETNVFARMSRSIIDTLAKHWTTTRGAEIVALTIVSSQLLDKQQKHERFLQFLALSKCHEELCSKQREALQIILEHGEKLAGVIQLRELQNVKYQNRSTPNSSLDSSSDSQISGALWDLIQLVGERARRNTVLLMDRDNAEVFYSKVSDLEEVFYCLEKHLEYVISEDQAFEVQIQRACELSNAVVSLLHAAMHYKNEHHIWYPPPEGLTPWYCQTMVRNGLWRTASFMLQLLKGTSGINDSLVSDLYSHLESLAEVLLEAYSGAITAKIECGQEPKGLLDEYWNRRDSLLVPLYEKLKEFAEGGHQALNFGINEQTGEILRKISSGLLSIAKRHEGYSTMWSICCDLDDSMLLLRCGGSYGVFCCQALNFGINEQTGEILRKISSGLLSIAKRHEGYSTMWSICCDLDDSMLLKSLMNESMGPKGGFSHFVFQELCANKQFSKLLRLGEEFQEELSLFLKHHPDLLWLHEVFLHQFSSASETLHSLALSQDECSVSEAEDGADPEHVSLKTTLADRKRLLNLSKIAAMAGKDVDSETRVRRIDADLKILKLQEEIVKVLKANSLETMVDGHSMLRPEELIELCLKSESPELALLAFDIFAWTSSSFRRSHRNLLEECWKNAADQDDWGQLYQASIDEGWTDEETLQQLRETVLFQASSRCYGPNAETIDEGFDQVLPLSKEDTGDVTEKDLDYCVETILMQHKDFPEAGKLMLTAVMLGSQGVPLADNGATLME